MVGDWKHNYQCYKRKEYEVKEGGQARKAKACCMVWRLEIEPFLHIIVSLIIGIDGEG